MPAYDLPLITHTHARDKYASIDSRNLNTLDQTNMTSQA